MKIPLSWLKDFVDVDLSITPLAHLMTMLGLEVESILLIGLPSDASGAPGATHEFKIEGLSWDADKIVVAQIDEVLPHPNADRLTLCRLKDGLQEHLVLTGAPNLFQYKGIGPLAKPLKVAYAREGARIYDGHQPGQVPVTLKRAKIRGVESYSMVCSEKELGISDEHEGILILDENAPTGMPLVDYMGDAVFEISILPNTIRDANVLGVAREVAAATGKPLRKPVPQYAETGAGIAGQVDIQITDPALNPRFVLGLIRNARPCPSPVHVQNRLRMAGMRPINSIVDATNYVMLEIGQPLHAFDYDVLVQRAGGKPPTIITRHATQGEVLTTLDGETHTLDSYSILVCDTAGALSIAGVMGGAESEVTDQTRTVLLEGAAWNFINIRKTMAAQKINSEAAYRFARGIHPALAQTGVELGLEYMLAWGGGDVATGLIDTYPLPQIDPEVSITTQYVKHLLDIDLSAAEIAALLERLEFTTRIAGDTVTAKTPPFRLDIGEGVTGRADLAEEIARLYGYNNIPATRLSDTLPAQRRNAELEEEERIRDLLVRLGLQEVINYRLTTAEREARLSAAGVPDPSVPYVRLANPTTPERSAMRRSLVAQVLENVERNIRLADRLAFFEIGPVFIPQPGQDLPAEPRRLAIAMTGLADAPAWDRKAEPALDFYDLKGMIETIVNELHLPGITYTRANSPTFHPGKSVALKIGEAQVGIFGELHPLVKQRYDFASSPRPILAAEFDLDALQNAIPVLFESHPVITHPPILEDIAVVVDEAVTAGQVADTIRQGGGKLLTQVSLFDIFRSEQVGTGKKSLAYNLIYQATDRTLTDKDATQIRQRIIRRLEQELGAKLRS